ncbi:elongation factor Tu domain 2 protein [Methanococcus aeolicus Nankai-3]|uniref:Elongation factor Tu domain 2 protein n=1 Tax=Methanococcus aeolicus (strain ATCC BAA-1280 / DSM 17508 / OCM 812 / Nankai-3) TaxID=419665 RepID=A6UVZ1_META3|nr:EF-Tu/IF-2/RF-3 family GTPase [Methanococcus aeolicus]ABR56663.1 elongation factor Tu domain 2 protein [Methanococcus aeolicus Nankai-3]
MKNIGIGLFGDIRDAGKNLGKAGTSTDITLYNYKNGDDAIFIIEPTKYPEKIMPLLYTINLMDYALIFVDEVKAELAETLLILDMCGVSKGALVVGEYVDVNQLKAIISNTSMKDFEIMEKDYINIREKLMELPIDIAGAPNNDFVKIPIDHFFMVRSVGTVILGRVLKGATKIHDNLRVYPTENKAMVKSIQVNDKNYDEAPQFSRVGLALKGVKAEDLDRGMILSNGDLEVSSELTLNMKWNPYMQKEIAVGEGYQINIGLQTVSSEVIEKEGDIIKLKLLKPVVYEKGDKAILIDGSAKIRIIGVSEL